MAAFDLAAACPIQTIVSQRQRDRLFDDNDGGITLNSEDDEPSSGLSTDSTFNGDDDDDDEQQESLDAVSAPATRQSAAMDAAGSGDSDDDDDDDNRPPPAQSDRSSKAQFSAVVPAVAGMRRETATCAICWDEQPYISDKTKRSAMNDRYADFRDVMYRYYSQMRGRQSQETVLRGMLDIRREKIERYLSEYSSTRFTRWTMEMLRQHFDPRGGHRFDPVMALDQEIEDLRQLQRWTMEHGMWIEHPQTGERVFNIRAVDVRLRVGRLYLDAITRKSAEMEKRSATAAGDTDMIMSAISTVGQKQSKRRRKSDGGEDESAIERMYSVGGM